MEEHASAVLNPHDSLLQKQSDGIETWTTNQHAQENFDQGASSDNSEEDFRRGKLKTCWQTVPLLLID